MEDKEEKSSERSEHKKTSAHKKYMEHEEHKKYKSYESIAWTLGIVAVILAVLFISAIATKGFSGNKTTGLPGQLSAQEVQTKTTAYLNNMLKAQGQTATVDSVQDAGDLYSLKITIGTQSYSSYARKDGSLLFPQGIDMSQNPVAASGSQGAQPAPTNVPKTDKPKVELFVMAYCPYGTQSEKGILPAVRALGDKVDFTIKFVDYSMHESFVPEVEENLRQYCIEKNQPAVYQKYLACFLNASDPQGRNANTTQCQQKTGVDVVAMNKCYSDTDTQYSITKTMADKSTWLSGQFPQFNIQKDLNTQYGVQGSPTLVINGVQASSGRDSQSYLTAICNAFNNKPSECSTQLSSTTPGPGFGYDSVGQAQAAGCGI